MAPNHGFVVEHDGVMEPRSRTYQYRKVMKPMLERKRRARINRCLDELKELMTSTFQAEGENVAKLEKADILELTVRHLHTLRRQNQIAIRTDVSYIDRFRAGFKHCAVEVSTFLGGGQEVRETTAHLIGHLEGCIRRLDTVQTTTIPAQTPSPPITTTPSTLPSSMETKLPLQLLQNRMVMPPPLPPRKRFNTDTEINFHSTPPISPNIDVEGFPVWRPW